MCIAIWPKIENLSDMLVILKLKPKFQRQI